LDPSIKFMEDSTGPNTSLSVEGFFSVLRRMEALLGPPSLALFYTANRQSSCLSVTRMMRR